MILLNNQGELLYRFNWEGYLDCMTKFLIIRKAYKGYVYYNTLEDKNSDYYTFTEFSEMDLWKIKFSYQIYLERIKKVKHLGFNPTNSTLLKHYFYL